MVETKMTAARWDALHEIVQKSQAGVMVHIQEDGTPALWMFGDLDTLQVSGLLTRGLTIYEHAEAFGGIPG